MVAGVVVSRWHGVLSKKPCLASDTKEFTVHGVLSASSFAPIEPIDVVIVTSTVPCTSGVDGGLETLPVAPWGASG